MRLTEAESRSCYGAAYDGFTRDWRGHGFEVSMGEDGEAFATSSGCTPPGYGVIFSNCAESDFGDWTLEDTTEDQFIDMCMECFGCIELPDD